MAENNYSSAVTKAKDALKGIRKEVTGLDADLKKIVTTLQAYANNKIPSGVADQLKLQAQAIKDLEATVKRLNERLDEKKKKTKVLTEAEMKLRVETNHSNASMKEQVTASKAVTDAMTKLNSELKIAKRNYQNIIVEGKRAGETQKQYNKRLRDGAAQFKNVQSRANAAKKAVSNFGNTSLGGLTRTLRSLMSAFGVIGGITLFANAARSAFNLTKQLDSMRFSMRAVITDGQEFAESQEFLRQIAQDYGADLLVVTNRFIKFRAATQQAGLSAKETQEIFGTMTKAAGVLGLKSDELKGVFLALEQMVSKGKITTEELRRQLGERLPGAMDIMANSMGVTTAELDKMLKKGEVITKDVLPGFAREVEKAYGLENVNRVETLQASTERLGNAWTILVEDFAKGNGVTKVLMGVFNSLAKNLGTIVKLTINAVKVFALWKTAVMANVLVGKLYARSLLTTAFGFISVQKQAWAATVMARGFTMALLTNPLTLFLVGLASVVAMFWDFGEGAEKSAEEIADLNKELTEAAKSISDTIVSTQNLIEEYEKLKDSKVAEEQKRLKEVIKQIGETVPDAVTALNNYNEATAVNIVTTQEFIESQKELALSKASDAIRTQSMLLLEQEEVVRKVGLAKSGSLVRDLNNYATVKQLENGLFEVRRKNHIGKTILYGEEHTEMLQFVADAQASVDASKRIVHANEDVQLALGMEANERQKLEAQMKKDQADKDAEQKAINDAVDLRQKYNAEIKKQKDIMADLNEGGLLEGELEAFNAAKTIKEEQEKLLANITEKIIKKNIAKKEEQELLEGTVSWYNQQISALSKERDKLAENTIAYEGYNIRIEALIELLEKLKGAKDDLDFSDLESQKDSFESEALDKEVEGLLNKGISSGMSSLSEHLGAPIGDLYAEFNSQYDKDFQSFLKFSEMKIDQAEAEAEAKKAANEEVLKNSIATLEAGMEFVSAVFDAKAQKYEDDIQRNKDYYAQQLDNELLTTEQRDAIEAERDAKERELEKKKRKEERKAAIANKAASIVMVAINTAVAISKVTAQLAAAAPLLIPSIIASGVAQAATIAAQPIPKYAKGTMNAPEGVALVDERVPEVHTDARGNIKSFGGSAPNLRYLEKGDKIYKSREDFFNYGEDGSIERAVWNMNAANLSPMSSDKYLAREMEKMVKAIERKNMSVRLNQNINLSDDLNFLFNKNDTL